MTGRTYQLLVDGEELGPYTAAEVRTLLAGGTVTGATQVWHEGLGGWTALGGLAEFAVSPPPLPLPVGPQKVNIVGLDMPFGDLVWLLVRLALASIPALVIVWVLFLAVVVVVAFVLGALGVAVSGR